MIPSLARRSIRLCTSRTIGWGAARTIATGCPIRLTRAPGAAAVTRTTVTRLGSRISSAAAAVQRAPACPVRLCSRAKVLSRSGRGTAGAVRLRAVRSTTSAVRTLPYAAIRTGGAIVVTLRPTAVSLRRSSRLVVLAISCRVVVPILVVIRIIIAHVMLH